jgi:hypothetical protein
MAINLLSSMRRGNTACSHKNCCREEKIWLPREPNHTSEDVLHHWCIHCGLVKNISDDRPKKFGYWMNILSKLSHNFSVTQCQRRLMVKELESHEEFEDFYGITGSAQKEIFIKIIRKYCNLSSNSIDSFLC